MYCNLALLTFILISSLKNNLTQSQDKALRRISEMKEVHVHELLELKYMCVILIVL